MSQMSVVSSGMSRRMWSRPIWSLWGSMRNVDEEDDRLRREGGGDEEVDTEEVAVLEELAVVAVSLSLEVLVELSLSLLF